MRKRELYFLIFCAVVLGTIGAITFVVCWPFARLMRLRDRMRRRAR